MQSLKILTKECRGKSLRWNISVDDVLTDGETTEAPVCPLDHPSFINLTYNQVRGRQDEVEESEKTKEVDISQGPPYCRLVKALVYKSRCSILLWTIKLKSHGYIKYNCGPEFSI